MTHELPLRIEGKGEVKGTTFYQEFASENGYIYRAESPEYTYFEIFLRKENSVCLDFDKRIYSDTEFKVQYPKSSDFGIWAWWSPTLEEAYERFYSKIN